MSFLVILYLVSIIIANQAVAVFGIAADIPVSFLLIGLDLTCRDRLHDLWRNNLLVAKMGLLIASGSLLSYLLNTNSVQIAIASFAAFALSAVGDSTVYQLLHKHNWVARANGSNLAGAAIDSLIFPTIAFGAFIPWLIAGQFAAKVVGGFVWSIVLSRRK